MMNTTNVTRQMLLASAIVMAVSGVASAQTTNDVTSRDGAIKSFFAAIATVPVPYYVGTNFSVVGTTPPRGQFAANQHVCANFVLAWGGKKYVNIELSGGGSVYAVYSPENFIPDPANTPKCAEAHQQYIQEVSKQLIEKLRQDSEQSIRDSAQSTSTDQRTGDAGAAITSSGTSAQSPEQPPSEATHFAQVDSSKLSTALNGKTLIPTIEIGYKASTANPAIINGHPAMFPVKTLIYPDGRENFRIEYGILHADANQHQSFKSGMRFQVTKVIIKDDCLELEIPMFTEGAILDKSFRGDVKFMFGKGWQSSMTTESVLQTVMRYLPDTETIAKAKAEAERVRAEEAEKVRIAAETIAKAKAEAERVRAEEAEKARIAAEQPPSEASQAKSNVGGTGTNAGPLEAGYAAERRGDFQAAFLLYEPLAKQGNAKAQFQLGHMYHEGNGVPQDYVKALEWFRKAADQGNADAQINLGSMYYVGQVVLQDYAEALKLYRKAADQGNARAQKLITSLNLNEKTVEQQMAKSTVPVLPDPHLQHPKEARAALSFLERDLTISTDFAGAPEPGLASLQSINGGLCHLRCGFHLAVGFGEGGVQNSEFEFALSDINMETISYHKDAIGRAILSFDTSDGTPRFSRRDREMDMNQKVLSPWSEWEGTDKGLCRAKGNEDSLERDMKALAFLAKECGATPSPF